MRSKCKCPKCGTPLVLKGGKKGEVKAKAKLLLTMQVEQTYICPKCGYEQKSQTIMAIKNALKSDFMPCIPH